MAKRAPQRLTMNWTKPGDVVVVVGNALFAGEVWQATILSVGDYPSLWLARGDKRWGATFEYRSVDEHGRVFYEESSPQTAAQFSWHDGYWELQLS